MPPPLTEPVTSTTSVSKIPARRSVLAVLGLGLAAAGCAPVTTVTKAAGSTTPKPTTKPTPKPTATPTPVKAPTLPATTTTPAGATVPNMVGTDPIWHLLRRTTFGPTPALVAEVKTMGATAWLNQQLAPATIDDSICDAYLTRYPTLPMTTVQLRAALPAYAWDAMNQLGRATVARALFSKRQLFEVMVEFWSNHFNITNPSGDVWDLKSVDDREVIRKNALGNFSDMLLASAKSPAMLQYLNNAQSSVDGINENYGREILELHTVGIGAGYTHTDVINSARILTGNTIGVHGEFAYYNDRHYVGAVKMLGFSAANADEFAGLALLPQYTSYLAKHPSTAQHLATKLATRFVSDTPPASLINTLASVYLANNTAIVPVLKALFASAEFAASVGQKTRRPIEDVIGAARTLGVTPAAGDANSLSGLYWLLNTMGQAPLAWNPPNGFPDVAGAWLSAGGTMRRWNAHTGLVGAWWTDGMATPATATLLASTPPATIGTLIDALSVRLIGIKLTGAQRSAIVNFACSRTTGATENTSSANTIRWDLGAVTTLILNTPNWIER